MPTIAEMVEEIREAANGEGTETGEYWAQFISLYPRILDSSSEEFERAWKTELDDIYKDIKTNYKWVEEVLDLYYKDSEGNYHLYSSGKGYRYLEYIG